MSTEITPKYLSIEDIIAVDDLEYRDVYIPAWKGTVRLRSLTAQEAIDFMKELKGADKDQMHIKAIAMVAVGPDGSKLVKTKEQEKKLLNKKSAVYQLLQDVFLEMNGFKKTEEQIKAEREAAKKED